MGSSLSRPTEANKPKFLDQIRQLMRLRHYSRRTEEAYIGWIRRYILFHGKRHPRDLGESDIAKFLSSLAVEGRVAASTQNQALNALLFLYKEVLRRQLGFIGETVRAKRPAKLPVVLSRAEVKSILENLPGQYRLIGQLLYGSGLRLLECLRLRVKDVDLQYLYITVREPKGGRERKTMLPVSLAPALREHLEKVKQRYQQDLADGFGSVHLPGALERKLPSAYREWPWQYVFPAERRSIDPRTGIERRHHVNEKNLQNAVKTAVTKARLSSQLSHIATFICDAFARERTRYPHGAGVTRPQRREHYDDLYTCAQQAGDWCEKSFGLRRSRQGSAVIRFRQGYSVTSRPPRQLTLRLSIFNSGVPF